MPTDNFNKHFPDYEILGELGRSNARVLKARHRSTGDLVAIKHFAFHTDEDTIRRFQRESEIMTSIDHPNVVRIREVRFDADLPYIVMELIEGGDVRSLLNTNSTLDVATIIRLGLQMADALKTIHNRGIIHRDIKPDNIMYRRLQSGELHFLLTDFGIAKLREQPRTQTGQSSMTYEYASPEQYQDPSGVTEATDFYSLGVVLYECLSGQVPFALGSTGIGALSKRIENELPAPLALTGYVPVTLQQVVADLLVKQPQQRLASTTVLKRRLKKADLEWEEGENMPAPEPSTPTPGISEKEVKGIKVVEPMAESTQPGTTTQRSWIIAAIVLVAVTVGLFFLYERYRKAKQANELTTIDSTILYPADTTATVDTTTTDDQTPTDNLQQEAEAGDVAKQVELGDLYYQKMNFSEALKWYQKAAEQDDPTAQVNLAAMYRNGDGMPQNYHLAFLWYQKAAEQGDATAQTNLGHLYLNGNGVAKDYYQASVWYQKAAEQDDATAQTNLGWLYRNGYGVTQDYAQAFIWYQKAANQGSAPAQNNLGWLFEEGIGTPKNKTEAIRWYKAAAKQNHQEAINGLKRLGEDISEYEKQ